MPSMGGLCKGAEAPWRRGLCFADGTRKLWADEAHSRSRTAYGQGIKQNRYLCQAAAAFFKGTSLPAGGARGAGSACGPNGAASEREPSGPLAEGKSEREAGLEASSPTVVKAAAIDLNRTRHRG